MNASEIATMIGVLRASGLKNAPRDADKAMTAKAWAMVLDDVPAAWAEQALAVVLKEETWFPAPSLIRTIALDLQAGLPSPERAWQMAQPGRPKPPEAVLAALRDIGGTHAIRTTDQPYKLREAFLAAYDARREEARHQTAYENRSTGSGLNGTDHMAIGTPAIGTGDPGASQEDHDEQV